MWFFRKKKQEPQIKEAKGITLPHREVGAAIEIVAHKEAKQEMVDRAKIANEHLNGLLVENGFTLKIYLAAKPDHHNL
jgi:hypothetical protein